MGRIFNCGNKTFDLGNIKHIDRRDFSGSNDGCYVQIHLLKGHEYIFNPDTETTELIKPVIEIGFGNNSHAIDFIETISEEWERYLESKETDKKAK